MAPPAISKQQPGSGQATPPQNGKSIGAGYRGQFHDIGFRPAASISFRHSSTGFLRTAKRMRLDFGISFLVYLEAKPDLFRGNRYKAVQFIGNHLVQIFHGRQRELDVLDKGRAVIDG